VLLLGDLMMDEWVFGSVKRISPEAPIPVVRMPLTDDARADKPGGAGNVAAILLSLGAAVRVVGLVGDDELGLRLKADLARRGADVSGVLTDNTRPTTHKLRILAGRQQLVRIDTESTKPVAGALADRLCETLRAGMREADVMLVADYAKGVLTSASLPPDLIASARAAGTPLCADPKPANMDLLRGAWLVSPNEAEALEAAGVTNGPLPSASHSSLPAAVVQAGQTLLSRLEAEAVFITRGERGIAVFCRDGTIAEAPTTVEPGSVGDGTGCGDAASATSALALAAGATFLEAAELANAAGGVVSRFVGVHDPRPEEVVEWVSRGSDF
jgi:D-beta-D-heptose 7-phosphate kinase/D-beta-D-heptose 1-phosphate adenosyltransferase